MARTKKQRPFVKFGAFMAGRVSARGLTQAQLARTMGVTPRSVARMLAGEILLSYAACAAAAPALGVTVDDIARELGRYAPSLKELRRELRDAVPLSDLLKESAHPRRRSTST